MILTRACPLALAPMQIWLHKSVNGNVPDLTCGGVTIPMGWLSGYLAMVTGLFVTIAVQSSPRSGWRTP